MAYDITKSTDYGGKEAPTWMQNGFYFPGYHNAYLSVLKKSTNEQVIALSFKVSPSTFTDARSKLYQLVKTLGGWMMQRLGNQPIEINLGGYMLDMMGVLERHDFIENYKTYIEDQKNYTSDYYNDYYTKLVIEGREYYGTIANLSFSKQAQNSPFLYQYNLSFVAFGEKKIYDVNYAAKDARILEEKAVDAIEKKDLTFSQLVIEALTTNPTKFAVLNTMPNSSINTGESAVFQYANSKVSQELSTLESVILAVGTVASSAQNILEDITNQFEKAPKSIDVLKDARDRLGAENIRKTISKEIIGDIYMLGFYSKQVLNGDKTKIYDPCLECNVPKVIDPIDPKFDCNNPDCKIAEHAYKVIEAWITKERPHYMQLMEDLAVKLKLSIRHEIAFKCKQYDFVSKDDEQKIEPQYLENFVNDVVDKLDSMVIIISQEKNDCIVDTINASYRMRKLESLANSIYTLLTEETYNFN